jgi:hypothetical protein
MKPPFEPKDPFRMGGRVTAGYINTDLTWLYEQCPNPDCDITESDNECLWCDAVGAAKKIAYRWTNQ